MGKDTQKQINHLADERCAIYRFAGKKHLTKHEREQLAAVNRNLPGLWDKNQWRERLTEINRLLPTLWDQHRRELALNARPENDMGRPGNGWWAKRELFSNIGRCQSSTEAAAMLRLRHQAVRVAVVEIETRQPNWDDVFDDWGTGVLREVLSELRHEEIREAV